MRRWPQRDGIIERLKAQLAWLRRQQFGRSSEKIEREIDQLELQLEDLEESHRGHLTAAAPEPSAASRRAGRCLITCRARRSCTAPGLHCPDCGGAMRRLGEDGPRCWTTCRPASG